MSSVTSTPTVATQFTAGALADIDEVNRRFEQAIAAGDAEAAAGVYTRGARVLPPGSPSVQGRDQAAGFWKAVVAQLRIRAIRLETQELQPAGDRTACEIGRATLTLGDGSTAVAKYVVLWRQEEGRWLWDVDIWNFDA